MGALEDFEKEHIKRIDRELVFKGNVVDFYQDTMELPNGKREKFDFVEHRMGAAAVVAVRDDGKLIMVRQYRPALDRFTIEIPAGKRDSIIENTKITARRELMEETGYIPGDIKRILSLKTTVAFCNEFIDVYLATGLHDKKDQHLDEDENIDILFEDLNKLLDMIYSGDIQDSKTVAGILCYKTLLDGGKI